MRWQCFSSAGPLYLLLTLLLARVTVADWVLNWHDEFDGFAVDMSKWRFDYGHGSDNEVESYTNSSENTFVWQGNLVILTDRGYFQGRNFTSGRICTQGLYSAKYGRFEMSAILPQTMGIWPAFWLFVDDKSSKKYAEIDIMEMLGREPTHIYGTVHSWEAGKDWFHKPTIYEDKGGFSTSYHTYAVEWAPNTIKFSVDGHEYSVVRSTDISANMTWPFDDPGLRLFILVNTALGGEWPGPPDSTSTFPQLFIIDYIRVYQWI